MSNAAPANQEAIEAWNTVLFEKFVKFRDLAVVGIGQHGTAALGAYPPARGARVLDVGCGFGDSTLEISAIVGPDGSVVGTDAAARFVEVARAELDAAAVENVSYTVGDMQTMKVDGPFDYAFARFSTMFVTFPVPAFRNLRAHLRPGGQLCVVVWRRKPDNEWLHAAERVVERFVSAPDESDQVTCGPGPFSQASADVLTEQLIQGGFEDVVLRRNDVDICIGRNMDEAIDFALALGPAGEVVRLAGDDAHKILPDLEAALREELAAFRREDGIWAPSSTWIALARNPG